MNKPYDVYPPDGGQPCWHFASRKEAVAFAKQEDEKPGSRLTVAICTQAHPQEPLRTAQEQKEAAFQRLQRAHKEMTEAIHEYQQARKALRAANLLLANSARNETSAT